MTDLTASQAGAIRAAVEMYEGLAGAVGVDGEEPARHDVTALGDGTTAVTLDEPERARYTELVFDLLTGLYTPGDEDGGEVDWRGLVEAGVALGLPRSQLPQIR